MVSRIVFCIFTLFLGFNSMAQFWFGPKVGASYTSRNYADSEWKDRYNVKNTVNAHFGGVLNYTTHEVFSVHTELYFETTKNTVESLPGSTSVLSNTKFSTINLPFLLRYRVPYNQYLSMYFNVGPRISYWLNGSGDILTDDDFFARRGLGTIDYDIKFTGERSVERMILDNPKRLKYALEFGTGFYIDLMNHKRIMLDARYSVGHSFMSFNKGAEQHLELDNSEYVENFEYKTNMLQLSISYLFGFDPIDSRRGRSTSKQK